MRRDTDRGVTVVEAAFVLPLLLLLVFGLIDLGMWSFSTNQATNAARDGARAAILSFEGADVVGSDDHDAVLAAVRARLPRNEADAAEVTVRCLTAAGATTSCATAEPDEDRVQVEVEWAWSLITPVAGVVGVEEGTARGSATMGIVGLPVSGSGDDTGYEDDPDDGGAEGTCAVPSTPIVTPSTVNSQGNQLTGDLKVEFTTNGDPGCNDLRIQLVGTKEDPTRTTVEAVCGCGDGPSHEWIYKGSDNIWKSSPPDGLVRILNGTTPLATRTFVVS